MWDKTKALATLASQKLDHSHGRCAQYVRQAVEAGGVTLIRHISAKDYGSSLVKVGFVKLDPAPATSQAGDVGVVQPIPGHPHGHIAMFDGKHWISDFLQLYGLYPGNSYRKIKPATTIYRYETIYDNTSPSTATHLS